MNEFYKENIETVVKEFNTNSKDSLDENKIKLAMQKYGHNVGKNGQIDHPQAGVYCLMFMIIFSINLIYIM